MVVENKGVDRRPSVFRRTYNLFKGMGVARFLLPLVESINTSRISPSRRAFEFKFKSGGFKEEGNLENISRIKLGISVSPDSELEFSDSTVVNKIEMDALNRLGKNKLGKNK